MECEQKTRGPFLVLAYRKSTHTHLPCSLSRHGTKNTHAEVYMWTYDAIFLGQTPKCRNDRLCAKCLLHFFKKSENPPGTWLEDFTFPSAMHEDSINCYVLWFCFYSNQIIFYFSLWFLFWLRCYLEVCCLLSKYLAIPQISFCCWFLIKSCCSQRTYFVWSQFSQVYWNLFNLLQPNL